MKLNISGALRVQVVRWRYVLTSSPFGSLIVTEGRQLCGTQPHRLTNSASKRDDEGTFVGMTIRVQRCHPIDDTNEPCRRKEGPRQATISRERVASSGNPCVKDPLLAAFFSAACRTDAREVGKSICQARRTPRSALDAVQAASSVGPN